MRKKENRKWRIMIEKQGNRGQTKEDTVLTANICLHKMFATGFNRGINCTFAILSCRMRLGDMLPHTPWGV